VHKTFFGSIVFKPKDIERSDKMQIQIALVLGWIKHYAWGLINRSNPMEK